MKALFTAVVYAALLPGLSSCDSSSMYQGNEVAATKKIKEKVQKVQAELRRHCDSMIYREAGRIADSVIASRHGL
ncbi:MAG: hypothetical protein ABIX01_17340 [Chitinophagaceae bacterium]